VKVYCPECGEGVEIFPSINNIESNSYDRELIVEFDKVVVKHTHKESN
jgi:hypothetical protein